MPQPRDTVAQVSNPWLDSLTQAYTVNTEVALEVVGSCTAEQESLALLVVAETGTIRREDYSHETGPNEEYPNHPLHAFPEES
jgi:hypothetical protein